MLGNFFTLLLTGAPHIVKSTVSFDVGNGGALVLPGGPALPGATVDGGVFYHTGEETLYRYTTLGGWVASTAVAALHAATHENGGSDELTGDLLKITHAAQAYTGGATLGDHLSGVDARLERDTLYAEDLIDTSTTISASWESKLSVTVNPSHPGTNQYMLWWSYGWNHNSGSNDFESRITLDADTVNPILFHKQEPKDAAGSGPGGTNQRYPASGFIVLDLPAGSNTLELEFRTSSAGVLSTMYDARLYFTRIV